MRYGFTFLFGFFLLLSCEEKEPFPKPDHLLSEDKYLNVFLELELLRIYQNRGADIKTVDSLYHEIMSKYELQDSVFHKSHSYYQTQIDRQQIRVDTVIARIERELSAVNRLDSLMQAQESETNE